MYFGFGIESRCIVDFRRVKLFEDIHKKLIFIELIFVLLLIRVSLECFAESVRLLIEGIQGTPSHNIIESEMVDFFH